MKRSLSVGLLILFFLVTSIVFYKKIFLSTYVVSVSHVVYKGNQHMNTEGDYQLSFKEPSNKTLYLYTNQMTMKKFIKNKHYTVSYEMKSSEAPYNYVLKSFHQLD